MRSLQDRLTSLLDGDEGVGLAFAVIDATDGSLRYSRVGPNPTVMVAGSGSPDELSMPEERVVAFKSNRGPGGEVRVIEGRCSLSQGDSVILFTDGIVKELTLNKTTPGAEFGRLLMKTRDGGSESLQDALAQEMSERSRRAKKKGLDDDLTAVIVKLDAGERSVAEGSEG
jgi:serine phosphatase RsbU (regulator of sigma subunit)